MHRPGPGAGVGHLLRGGSERAAGDARMVLDSGGRGGTKLGQVMGTAPIASAGEIQGPGKFAAAGQSGQALHFVSTGGEGPQPTRSTPPPRDDGPAPGTWTSRLDGNGRVRQVEFSGYRYDIERDGQGQVRSIVLVYPGAIGSHPQDGSWQRLVGAGVIQAGYAPGRVAVEVWNRGRNGGSAQVGESGIVSVRRGDQTLVFQPTGTYIGDNRSRFVFWPGANGRIGSVDTPSGSYSFRYGADGQMTEAIVRRRDGTQERWVRPGNGNEWAGPNGRRLSGPNGPQSWPDLLLNYPQIVAVASHSERQIGDLRQAIGRAWQQALEHDPVRFVTGVGFSGNGGSVVQMSRESEQILQAHRQLQDTVRQLRNSSDPAEVARLTEQFIRQDNDLRARLNRFADSSRRIIRNARIVGDIHAIAGDIYSLGTNSLGYGSSSTIIARYEQFSALRSVYSLGGNIYHLNQSVQPTDLGLPGGAAPRDR